MPNTKAKLLKLNPEAVLLDSWADAALIGMCTISDFLPVALYSKRKIYAVLESRGIVAEDLVDYYVSSVVSLRGGEFTPVIFDDLEE